MKKLLILFLLISSEGMAQQVTAVPVDVSGIYNGIYYFEDHGNSCYVMRGYSSGISCFPKPKSK